LKPVEIPAFVRDADRALSRAAVHAKVLTGTTPQNLRAELERLQAVWSGGSEDAPRFTYATPAIPAGLATGLMRLADGLDREGRLGAIYAARAREIAHELELCQAVGGLGFVRAATARFSRRDRFDDEADALAMTWLANGDELEGPEELPRFATDDEGDPGSLVSAMRRAVSERRLPFRVVLAHDMAALAATGDEAIVIARGMRVSARDVARTVLHEIDGHAAPRVVASTKKLGIFTFGTARGSDDQEGRALSLEQKHGFLEASRRRELALRHVAARSVERGASFIDTMRLLGSEACSVAQRIRVSARAHRGGGLARERVYLPALLRVKYAVASSPAIERVLASGRVAVDAAPMLEPWLDAVSV